MPNTREQLELAIQRIREMQEAVKREAERIRRERGEQPPTQQPQR